MGSEAGIRDQSKWAELGSVDVRFADRVSPENGLEQGAEPAA